MWRPGRSSRGVFLDPCALVGTNIDHRCWRSVASEAMGVYHGGGDARRCAVKRIAIWIGGLFLAADIMGATVVLKGGKRLEVASYVVGGSYVVVQYAGGRRESY